MSEIILGKVIIRGKIRLKTGLHIGAQTEAIEIGGIDNPVIKDPLTGKPYIPGSSLKGKMRSLLEKAKNAEQPEDMRGAGDGKYIGRNIGTANNPIWIHSCEDYNKAKGCEVCRLFGTSSKGSNFPARTIFRDAHLCDNQNPDEIIEIKYETGIDRITSAANPRPMERVVPGTEFEFEIVYNVEDENDKKTDLENLIKLMKMLEDDYLGGSGSRGYGKVEFAITEVVERSRDYYLGSADQNLVFSDEEGKRPEEVLLEISGKL
ncbi:CRISPR type III-A/MTUBE-associated RAMP protein Csm3 [Archaeoglobus fulgidus DSM 8774]|uniref:CRISPR system Cms endoribonuclease Csm3 n=1 Tax=Archaeoglobus fulgidus DSM 8774 TaxID=1344584 RepID=A0A075WAL0_ARCFL|nr:type III-A CRISPR-associated RAMP protein Csm3 [Archaeoglobus fulgidus]AIG97430.1 CRISPR type III-A/MTUBE-associated RAMP protein Csm3 [Archaeoglobus fulgidus DSM 8774]